MTTPEPTKFARLQLSGWRQFGHVDIVFHPRLTVLTGSNGSGKTTLLNLLGRHFNWAPTLLGSWSGSRYSSSLRRSPAEPWASLGNLQYTNDGISDIQAPAEAGGVSYQFNLPQQQNVPGLSMASHRSLSNYQQVASIPVTFSAASTLYSAYFSELWQRFSGSYSAKSPMLQMKEALIAAAVYGEGNSSVTPNPEAAEVWAGFNEVLRALLPEELAFETLLVRSPELVLVTRDGEYLIDAVSGGVSALLETGWQIFLRSRESPVFTVRWDEPENHLHPQMQRQILPRLLDAFPGLTFVVATHSPFIVTAVPDSHIYALSPSEGGVDSRSVDAVTRAGSAETILRDVLGVPTSIPLWAEDRLDGLLQEVAAAGASPALVRSLYEELVRLGLEAEFPAAVAALRPGGDGASAN